MHTLAHNFIYCRLSFNQQTTLLNIIGKIIKGDVTGSHVRTQKSKDRDCNNLYQFRDLTCEISLKESRKTTLRNMRPIQYLRFRGFQEKTWHIAYSWSFTEHFQLQLTVFHFHDHVQLKI
jgi:hypothetical protein